MSKYNKEYSKTVKNRYLKDYNCIYIITKYKEVFDNHRRILQKFYADIISYYDKKEKHYVIYTK